MSFDRCPPEFVMLGHKLADAVRPITKKHFHDAPTVNYKDDRSPVTIADTEAEAKIRKIIEKERPQDSILGEEYGTTNEGAEFTWIIDPIDGTKPYTLSKACFGTLIALQRSDENGDELVFGLCDQSITGDRWTGAKGHPTLWNGHAVTVRKNTPDNMLIGACMNPLRFDDDVIRTLKDINKAGQFMSCGGGCLNFCLLASGRLDFVLETGQEIYDVAALMPILSGAGATLKMLDGHDFIPGSTDPFIVVADEKRLDLFI